MLYVYIYLFGVYLINVYIIKKIIVYIDISRKKVKILFMYN